MAVAYDVIDTASSEDVTTLTSSPGVTVASTANRFALMGVYKNGDGGASSFSSSTLFGASGTFLAAQSDIGFGHSRISRSSTQPTAGATQTFSVTNSDARNFMVAAAIVLNGVDQTTPINSTATPTTGDFSDPVVSGNPSITVTTVSDGMAVGILFVTNYNGEPLTVTPGTGVTVRANVSLAAFNVIFLTRPNNGGSTTVECTIETPTANGAEWRLEGFGIAPASSGYTVTAEQGSYSLTGQTAGLLATRILTAAQGSYALNGQDLNLNYNAATVMAAEYGLYTLVGSEALVDLAMNAAQGSYTLTGQDATLTFQGLTNPILTAEQGSYTLNGQATGLIFNRFITADMGQYNLTGSQAGLLWSGAPSSPGYAIKTISLSLKIGL